MPDMTQIARRVVGGAQPHGVAGREVPANGIAGRLTLGARDRLLTLGAACRFQPSEFVLREGERSDHVLLLTHGRVKLTSRAENGYAVVLGIRGPGDLVGEMAGLDSHPRSATVVALDPVLARIMSGSDFRDFIDHERLALVLLDLDRWHGVGTSADGNCRDIDLALSQADLAGLVGSSLESAAKAIRDLARQGIIRTRRRHVTILDRSALGKLADESL